MLAGLAGSAIHVPPGSGQNLINENALEAFEWEEYHEQTV